MVLPTPDMPSSVTACGRERKSSKEGRKVATAGLSQNVDTDAVVL
jgi:hypothetical protein